MLGVVRVLLIWLLAVSVPLKAIAMGSALGCGPGHHGDPAAQAAEAARTAVAHDLSDHGIAAGGDESQVAAELGDVLDHEHGGSPASHAKVKCGTCAPCCTAAAPAVGPMAALLDLQPVDGIPFAAGYYAGVQVDVPHRPPRT